MDSIQLRERLGHNAYHTIHDTWFVKNAAANFAALAKHWLSGNQETVAIGQIATSNK